MKHLTITATGGLCNRMRVLASLCSVAETLPFQVRVVWRSTSECRARFDQLFQPLPACGVNLDAGSWMDAPANRSNFRLPALFRLLCGYHEKRDFKPAAGFSLQQLAPDRHHFMDTCYSLADYPHDQVQRFFVPLPQLQDEIRRVTSTFDPCTLGVHIRRTDNAVSIQHSPVQAFVNRLDAMFESGEITKAFLCTDDEEVRQQLRKRYGSRLLTREVCLSRGELSGIRDAVIDLWSLSRTARILGSYYSSFSDTAAELTGIPYEMINIQS